MATIHTLTIEKQNTATTCWAAASLCVLHHYGFVTRNLVMGGPQPVTQDSLTLRYMHFNVVKTKRKSSDANAAQILHDHGSLKYDYVRGGNGGDVRTVLRDHGMLDYAIELEGDTPSGAFLTQLNDAIHASLALGRPVVLSITRDAFKHAIVVKGKKRNSFDMKLLDPGRPHAVVTGKLDEMLDGRWDYIQYEAGREGARFYPFITRVVFTKPAAAVPTGLGAQLQFS